MSPHSNERRKRSLFFRDASFNRFRVARRVSNPQKRQAPFVRTQDPSTNLADARRPDPKEASPFIFDSRLRQLLEHPFVLSDQALMAEQLDQLVQARKEHGGSHLNLSAQYSFSSEGGTFEKKRGFMTKC